MTDSRHIFNILYGLHQGESVESLAEKFGTSVEYINAIRQQAAETGNILPPQRKKKPHELTQKERRRGLAAAKEKRANLRKESQRLIIKRINTVGAAAQLAAVAYYLAKGSQK